MLKPTVDNIPGVRINGQNVSNIRYTLSPSLSLTVRKTAEYTQDKCKAYSMKINVKKMKVITYGHWQVWRGQHTNGNVRRK